MNIVIASDDNFVQHCCVTMLSVLKNNKDVTFYLLTEGLAKENVSIITSMVTENEGIVNIIKVPKEVVSRLPMPKDSMLSHISVATYYRLFISSLLPSTVEKVIYLDCDMIVRCDISALYQTSIDKYALGAVYQDDKSIMDYRTFERLGYSPNYGYFNAGMLLINLKYWRSHNLEEQFMTYISTNYDKIVMHDQDVLNATLHNQVLMLDCKWNMLTSFFMRGVVDYKDSKCASYVPSIIKNNMQNPAIVHFASKPKAWDWACSHPFKRDYYNYLDMTIWEGWRPSFSFSKYNIIERLRGNKLVKIITPSRYKGLFN